jgi:DinB family protein
VDRAGLHRELDDARMTFHRLVSGADRAALHRLSDGTRWTNKQLLFHMLLGYLILRALRLLALLFSRLPDRAGRGYARLLNAGTRPFDAVNYLGSRFGGNTLSTRQMAALFDRTIARLHRRIDAESDADLARGMHYPSRWDPFFADYLTLADVYHFATQHFEFHRRQLTLRDPDVM